MPNNRSKADVSDEVATPPAGISAAMPSRLGIGVNVVLQMLLFALLFAGANFLSYRYYKRWDLTEGGDQSLSSMTLNNLSKLSKNVDITLLIPRNAAIYNQAYAILDEYKRNGKGRIRLELIDPIRDIQRAEQLKAETGLSLEQPGILLQVGKVQRYVLEDDLTLRDPSKEGSPVVGYRIEDAVTSSLIGLIEGEKKRFYMVLGKGSSTPKALAESLETLNEIAIQQNFDLQSLNLSGITEVPEDADAVLLVGIRYDLSDREVAILDAYWRAERAGLLLLLDPVAQTPRLRAMLERNGVSPRNDRVLMASSTSAGAKKEFSVEVGFSGAFPLTRPLADAITTLPGQTQSLLLATPDTASESMKDSKVAVTPLMRAAGRFWGEKNYLETMPIAEEEDGDTLAAVAVAAAVERGAVQDERLRLESSRMVVVGNADLIRPPVMLLESRDFVASSLNWIINRERSIGIPAKPARAYRIQLNPNQRQQLFTLTAFMLPGLAMGLGLLVWASRRSA